MSALYGHSLEDMKQVMQPQEQQKNIKLLGLGRENRTFSAPILFGGYSETTYYHFEKPSASIKCQIL